MVFAENPLVRLERGIMALARYIGGEGHERLVREAMGGGSAPRLMSPEDRAYRADGSSLPQAGEKALNAILADRADILAKARALPQFTLSEPREEVVCGRILHATPLPMIRLVDLETLLAPKG